MTAIIRRPNTYQKLEILSEDAQYDLACACSQTGEGRKRGSQGKWIYPITLPGGGKSVLFRTLISNICSNDCKYCPLRENMDVRRCALSPEQTAEAFMDYYRKRKVSGLFLSSGVIGSADATMKQLIATAEIVRKTHKYRGYIHLKIIPGASKASIEEAVRLSSAVSLNIETPGALNFSKLSNKKNYINDIIQPIKYISELTAKGSRFDKVKQTTQFIVGAAGEKDSQIVKYMGGLYDRLKMHRVFFSAYQKGLGQSDLPGENIESEKPENIFTREHRLYQVDYLLRKYGFSPDEIEYEKEGSLALDTDPKEYWALKHPEIFPVNVNKASQEELLRVPGLGHVTVQRIIERRRQQQLREISDIGKVTVLLKKASGYIIF
ncbi:MAG: radical SAM protein [Sedimentisphaeraceae bacterium JB056]